ncbi:orotidine-5'-phosphate decarboxylase [Cryobacterium sp. CG_9.6]|uniref:orotidine-5'-phosphate decarboxylase n=1 Tax=Cryobacterium sp. CG_9.6 TaxID=2760710 RepID=UPI00247465E8|nr:orotidine-5'-phosphate decarboxylase [Cryobacterium sp. CG_9.6]MDH6236881.1 orotidine-5'-phosphate decarboxylase [Cryobacterium sp. CG_9.6]
MTHGSSIPGASIPGATFGERLAAAFASRGQLCVGIDPHSWLLTEWGLTDSAAGAETFGRSVVAAAVGRVGIVKPQVAFFERFGAAGFVALERVLADARAAGLLVIGDVKRGDLGTSVEAYADAWLTPGAPLEVDAITLAPYMGVASLQRPIDIAREHGKGLFLLAATSNPEAATVQQAVVANGPRAGLTVARAVLEDVAELNADDPRGGAGFGSIGVVLGATLTLANFGINIALAPPTRQTPVLAPGFGHQGGNIMDLTSIYGEYAEGVIVSESRSVLSQGPDRLAAAIERRATEVGAVRG